MFPTDDKSLHDFCVKAPNCRVQYPLFFNDLEKVCKSREVMIVFNLMIVYVVGCDFLVVTCGSESVEGLVGLKKSK